MREGTNETRASSALLLKNREPPGLDFGFDPNHEKEDENETAKDTRAYSYRDFSLPTSIVFFSGEKLRQKSRRRRA